jgi:ADP-dependent NAD(P)H-hydrate dehydratase / NAD(P)H-hydrate epimerase
MRPESAGEVARADYTVTFTAPKLGQVLPPNCDHDRASWWCEPIGTPAEFYPTVKVELIEPVDVRPLAGAAPAGRAQRNVRACARGSRLARQDRGGCVVRLGALRAGAGLVTVASAESATPLIAAHAPELMTEPLTETPHGSIATQRRVGPASRKAKQ